MPRDRAQPTASAMRGRVVRLGESVKLIKLNGLAVVLWCHSLVNTLRGWLTDWPSPLGQIWSRHQEGAKNLPETSSLSTCLLRGLWWMRGRAGGCICSPWWGLFPWGLCCARWWEKKKHSPTHTYTYALVSVSLTHTQDFVLWDVNNPLFNCINAGGTSKAPSYTLNARFQLR